MAEANEHKHRAWCPLKAVSLPGYPQTPEAYQVWQRENEERRQRMVAEGKWYRRGVPNGQGGKKQVVLARRAAARVEAKKIVEYLRMTDQVVVDDPRAVAALEYAIAVVRAGDEGTRERLSAAKLVLDFTKAKPASKSEVTVAKAEDFLTAIADKV